jgi:hypothetical protein
MEDQGVTFHFLRNIQMVLRRGSCATNIRPNDSLTEFGQRAGRLAFLSPEVTSTILDGRQPKRLSLARIPKLLPWSWAEHRPLIG